MLSFYYLAASTVRSAIAEIMRATAYPDINDETEAEEVPKAFIVGTSDGPMPLADLDIKEISLTTTEDFVNIVLL